MKQPSKMDKIEERLLKEIENLKDGMISFWTCSSNPNSSDEERIDHINIKLDQHRETKKAVYEDINNFVMKEENGRMKILDYINKKLGEEKLTSQKDGDKN
jgi:hypothetical protein